MNADWKRGLVAAVTNFHVADAIGSEDEDDDRYHQHAGNRDICGRWIRHHRERAFRDRYRHERVEIVNHADFFQQRRQEEVKPLPTVKQERRNDWVANEKTDNKEESSITHAREH